MKAMVRWMNQLDEMEVPDGLFRFGLKERVRENE